MRPLALLRRLAITTPALLAACTASTERTSDSSGADTPPAWEIDRYGQASAALVNGVSMVPSASTVFWADTTDPSSQPRLKWTRLDGMSRMPCDVSLPTAIFFGPSAAATPDPNVFRVFYGDWEGKLWYVDQNVQYPDICVARPNAPAQVLSGPGLITSNPSAIWRGADAYDVFYRGANGDLTQSQHTAGAQWWGAPIDLGTAIAGGPSAVFRPWNGNLNVYYRTVAGLLGESWWNGSAWGWVGNHGMYVANEPSAVASFDGSVERVDVYYMPGYPPQPNPKGGRGGGIIRLPPHWVSQLTFTSTTGWQAPVVRSAQFYAPLAAWDASHVVGVDYNDQLASLAPRAARTTRKVLLTSPAGTTTFYFDQVQSSGVSGPSLPSDVQQGTATTAVLQTDPHAQVIVLDQDSDGPDTGYNGFRPVSIFDTSSGLAPRWTELPYTYAGNGPDQHDSLLYWNILTHQPIKTIRAYDHGECWAHVGFDLLADQFFQSFVGANNDGPLTECHSGAFDISVDVGPVLESAENFGAPGGAALADSLFWDVTVSGDTQIKILGVCDGFGLGLDTRLTHNLGVVPAPNGPAGATRVAVGNFVLHDGASLGRRAPGWDEQQINGRLNGFPTQLTNPINESFVIPQLGAWALERLPLPLTAANVGTLVTCNTSADCFASAGPEDGCYFPTQDAPLSPAIVAWDANKQLSDSHTGVCVNRLEPKRVNVTPTGLDIVLIESTADALSSAVHTLATGAGGGGALQCASAPASPTDPDQQLPYETLDTETRSRHVQF